MYLMGYSKWLLLSSRLVAGESIISKHRTESFCGFNDYKYVSHTEKHVSLEQFKKLDYKSFRLKVLQ